MRGESYLQWLARATRTAWWHDSGDLGELSRALDHGARGVTTNPLLAAQALQRSTEARESCLSKLGAEMSPAAKAEAATAFVARAAAREVLPVFEESGGAQGYACAQVNPADAGNRDAMLAMARRFSALAPNIAVKLPATLAGLDTLETCAAEGIPTTLTVSFSVSQAIAIAERHRAGLARARAAGKEAGKEGAVGKAAVRQEARCFAVIMMGRLEQYLRDTCADVPCLAAPRDISLAGLAVARRCLEVYRARGYQATLLFAALRETGHVTGLAGADAVLSISPRVQEALLSEDPAREQKSRDGLPESLPAGTIERLLSSTEFMKAYEPDGLAPREFLAWGLVQRTLAQFTESGWNILERIAAR